MRFFVCTLFVFVFRKKEREKAVVLYSNVYMMNILGVVVFVGHVKDSMNMYRLIFRLSNKLWSTF